MPESKNQSEPANASGRYSSGLRGHKTPLKRIAMDYAARILVEIGGIGIILCVFGIFLFIIVEVWPLLGGAHVSIGQEYDIQLGATQSLVSDEYRTFVAALGADGAVRVAKLSEGKVVKTWQVLKDADGNPVRMVHTFVPPGSLHLAGASEDGQGILQPIRWNISFDGRERVITPLLGKPFSAQLDEEKRPVKVFTAFINDEGVGTMMGQLASGKIVKVKRAGEVDFLTDEVVFTTTRMEQDLKVRLTSLVIDEDQTNAYGGTDKGDIVWWQLQKNGLENPQIVSSGSSKITALSLLIGGRSLIVGSEDGSLSVWFPVRNEANHFELTKIREFPRQDGSIKMISPSARRKGFIAQDSTGQLGIYYSTSGRVLWKGTSPLPSATAFLYSPKEDGAFFYQDGRLATLELDCPHPEVSLTALFGKVWYEGYGSEDYVWQSSSGTDDFEPKLSLTPLIVGTLKGTFYSMILALPMGILGAMYVSQFMHPSLARRVKPAVEIMAALPSVVLGFLAGLWLAPLIEDIFCGLLMMFLVLPLMIVAAGRIWDSLPRALLYRIPDGAVVFPHILVVIAGMALCIKTGPFMEDVIFNGDFADWLYGTTELRFEQRNAIIVGLAMGFAVIPIIFAISEDAFSNVPRHLISGSLALGATRWETVIRVVLPTASPGIFSAVMVGLGRAVGETMIVLMATGNTPIMSWNPFNGFRTLSANIAVEIPEAPHGGTLYRALFLAALALFLMTFVVNTIAELIRQRLRTKYANL